MKILVTGGAGFIGSNLVFKLNQMGYTDITIVDRLGNSDKWRNLVGLVYEEYIEVERFSKIIDKLPTFAFDIIFALGACSSTRELNASYLIKNNYVDMLKLMQIAMQGSNTRFIYASSAATYGRGEMNDSLSPKVLRPLNAYGLSKNMIDQYAEKMGWLDRMVGLKYFNIFGPNCEHKGVMESFVTKAYRQLKETGQINLYDTCKDVPIGQDARDFLYVKDAVDMTLHFALNKEGKKANGLFNIGAGEAVTWHKVAWNVFDAVYGHTIGDDMIKINYIPMPIELKGKYQYYTKADITKLLKSGFIPNYPSTQVPRYSNLGAVRDYVNNYLMPDKKVAE